MKTLFLRSVKIEEHTEERENIIYTENEQGETEIDLYNGWYDDYDDHGLQVEAMQIKKSTGFDLDDYEQDVNSHKSKVDVIIKNTDGFHKYNFDTDYIVDIKTARTSIEEKRPFIVSKVGKKLGRTEAIDTIYKTSPKMCISDKNVQRLGFVVADERARKFKLHDRKKKHFKGIANDEIMITKKKGFNQKKIGYIKLAESTPRKDLYVEVTTNRGYKWLIALLIILSLLGLFMFTRDWSNWHLNLDKFRVYKTEEIIKYTESELRITLNATPALKDGKVNVNISSEYVEGITYIAKLYDESNNLIYESNEIEAGQGLSSIELMKGLSVGEHECLLQCESYRGGSYVGNVETDLIITVKGE